MIRNFFFILKSSGISKVHSWRFSFATQYCSDSGDDGQISPYLDSIWSIKNDGGFRRLQNPIELLGDDGDDKQGDIGDVSWIGNEHVESICSIVSCWIIIGKDDKLSSIGDDKQEQWVRDVIVFNNVKRIGM